MAHGIRVEIVLYWSQAEQNPLAKRRKFPLARPAESE
jgi:hypothetical protein